MSDNSKSNQDNTPNNTPNNSTEKRSASSANSASRPGNSDPGIKDPGINDPGINDPAQESAELPGKEVAGERLDNTVDNKDGPKTVVPIGGSGPPTPEEFDVPTNDGRYIKFVLLFLLFTLGSFSAWATWVPLSSAVIAMGEVVVDSYRKSIQHFEGGIVENIYVRNGDIVEAGDPLIRLDETQFEAQVLSNHKRLWTTKAELERLFSEQKFATQLSFSTELLQQAEQDEDIRTALEQQQQLFQARVSAFKQEQDAVRTRIGQSEQQISGLSAQNAIFQQQIESLQEEQRAYSTLYKEGLGDSLRANELNRLILTTQSEKGAIESEISRLKIQITETELQIATRKQDFLKEVGERIRQAQSDYYNHQERLQIAADRKTRSLIRAPEDGIVVGLDVHTIGAVVSPGMTLLDLVPKQDTFVVEAKLLTQDINDIYTGQKTDIRFPAFNTDLTKIIEGEVIHVSADRMIDEREGVPYYHSRIKITEQGYADMDETMELKPGMPAEVMIRREDRTFFSYLIKPIADSFARSMKER